MALSSNAVFEVQIGGNDTNGGGFVTGSTGTDFSLIGTARPNGGTDGSSVLAVAVGTTTITCADAQFTAAIVGNILYFAGGTGAITAVRRQVISRTNATTIVLDAIIAASTGMTMNIGGALLSPAVAAATMVILGQIAYIKYNATPFGVTSASSNVAGGVITLSSALMVGYDTTRTITNTDSNMPTIQAQVSTITVFTVAGTAELRNLIVDGNIASYTAVRGFSCGGYGPVAFNCYATNCSNSGFYAYIICINCVATGCGTTGGAFVVGICGINCVASSNTVPGFLLYGSNVLTNCISLNNTSATGIGFQSQARGGLLTGCIAYGNAGAGFDCGSYMNTLVGCISESNTGVGFANIGGGAILQDVAAFSNSGGNYGAGPNPLNNNNLILSSSAFVSAATGNFSLNSTTGAGAVLRATAIILNKWNSLPTTIGYRDIGAAQHLDSPSSIVVNNTMIIDPLKISSY